ncbi:MAG: GH1 family beta-glucosidase [Anaerolineae bacterium]|nr:GH1 family beta-glucosidase [Anaerolineae bacterium]
MTFPQGFAWGAATASYQIEGAASEDGKGLSIWDVFSHEQGKIDGGDTGDVASDHYHRWREDVALMAGIGLKAYRFSISWPRLLPEGRGAVERRGLGFYDRLVDGLLAAGIEPWVTLYHWDLPHALHLQGGWLNPAISDWFAEYTAVVVDALSDRVSHWMALNEPHVFVDHGYLSGGHAPGLRLDLAAGLQAGHNSLLAHGKAVQTIRARAKKPPTIGVAQVGAVRAPASEAPEDVAAAREAMFAINPSTHFNHAWFGDPMVLGEYPEDLLQHFRRDWPSIRPGDMETICQPLDFYGLNVYFAEAAVGAGHRVEPGTGPQGRGDRPGYTMMGWPVWPESIYWGLRFLWERYELPLVITENGLANTDWPHLDGRVHDPQRIDYLARYLLQVKRALDEGVDVRGYFVWSLLDNFEWARGFRPRFGLVYVDYEDQQRRLKDSAHWYRQVIETNGRALLPGGQSLR